MLRLLQVPMSLIPSPGPVETIRDKRSIFVISAENTHVQMGSNISRSTSNAEVSLNVGSLSEDSGFVSDAESPGKLVKSLRIKDKAQKKIERAQEKQAMAQNALSIEVTRESGSAEPALIEPSIFSDDKLELAYAELERKITNYKIKAEKHKSIEQCIKATSSIADFLTALTLVAITRSGAFSLLTKGAVVWKDMGNAILTYANYVQLRDNKPPLEHGTDIIESLVRSLALTLRFSPETAGYMKKYIAKAVSGVLDAAGAYLFVHAPNLDTPLKNANYYTSLARVAVIGACYVYTATGEGMNEKIKVLENDQKLIVNEQSKNSAVREAEAQRQKAETEFKLAEAELEITDIAESISQAVHRLAHAKQIIAETQAKKNDAEMGLAKTNKALQEAQELIRGLQGQLDAQKNEQRAKQENQKHFGTQTDNVLSQDKGEQAGVGTLNPIVLGSFGTNLRHRTPSQYDA